jgi:NADH:ubiquinone oxidoreductase subunit E
MAWELEEAVRYYLNMGAPQDQTALVNLLKEIQLESGGTIPGHILPVVAQLLGSKESYLQAVIRRIPSLRLAALPELQICAGPNCSKRAALASFVEKTYGKSPKTFTVKEVPCMRLCGKGPNIKWNGQLYHKADEQLIRSLVEDK